MLIVQNLRDPATPQGGHLAYLYLDNRCANDIATNSLLTGQRPAHDRAC